MDNNWNAESKGVEKKKKRDKICLGTYYLVKECCPLYLIKNCSCSTVSGWKPICFFRKSENAQKMSQWVKIISEGAFLFSCTSVFMIFFLKNIILSYNTAGMYPQGRPVRPRSHLNFQIP